MIALKTYNSFAQIVTHKQMGGADRKDILKQAAQRDTTEKKE